MKNQLTHLVDHLFVALERVNGLDSDKLDPDTLRLETQRAAAVVGIAREVISIGALALDAQKALRDAGPAAKGPALLGLDKAL